MFEGDEGVLIEEIVTDGGTQLKPSLSNLIFSTTLFRGTWCFTLLLHMKVSNRLSRSR